MKAHFAVLSCVVLLILSAVAFVSGNRASAALPHVTQSNVSKLQTATVQAMPVDTAIVNNAALFEQAATVEGHVDSQKPDSRYRLREALRLPIGLVTAVYHPPAQLSDVGKNQDQLTRPTAARQCRSPVRA